MYNIVFDKVRMLSNKCNILLLYWVFCLKYAVSKATMVGILQDKIVKTTFVVNCVSSEVADCGINSKLIGIV